VEIAKNHGSAELKTDNDGDPMIAGSIDGIKYQVHFYDCAGGKQCKNIQLYSWWTTRKKTTLEALNEWNRKKRFGKVYLDTDGDMAIIMPVNLDHGVSRKNLDDTFDWWETALKDAREAFK